MLSLSLLLTVFCLLIYASCLNIFLQARTWDADAEFALTELRRLSETGIYDSITIKNVQKEGTMDGIFHVNTLLKMELACPYFQSGKESEEFQFIIMKHKFENVTTLAVNEFPEMREDAIETFYIQMVKDRRRKRELAFAHLLNL
jgi:hypothetical protein